MAINIILRKATLPYTLILNDYFKTELRNLANNPHSAGTFLHCDAVNEVCENYLVSHMELGTVFDVFDVTAELGYKRINHHAIKLICNNLGEFTNESFITLSNSSTMM